MIIPPLHSSDSLLHSSSSSSYSVSKLPNQILTNLTTNPLSNRPTNYFTTQLTNDLFKLSTNYLTNHLTNFTSNHLLNRQTNVTNLTDEALQLYVEETLGKRHKDFVEAFALSIIYCIIFITGVVGNTCTGFIVARRSYMRTPTNFYLCSLALSDVITLIIGMPPELYGIWEAYPWIFGEFYCLLRTYLLDLTSAASVFTITTFTVERYFAIRYPLLSRTADDTLRRVPIIIVVVWLLAAIVAIPYPIHMGVHTHMNYPNTEIGIPDTLFCSPENQWKEFYNNLLLFSFVCLFIIPICIISVLYTIIAITISRPARRRHVMSSASSSSSTNQQSHKAVVKMLVAVVVAFFACWAPFHAQRLMATFIHSWSPLTIAIHNGLFHVSGILYYFACTINPILYNLMSKKYRDAFKDTLCCGHSKYENRQHSMYYRNSRVRHVVSFRKESTNGVTRFT